jgi:hypothetical protein
VNVVAQRLLDWISPNAFEHLVCQLLQLEHPTERWWHVGGHGDGGTDGLAVGASGDITAALQCKWKLNADPFQIEEDLLRWFQNSWATGIRIYVAYLFPNGGNCKPCEGVMIVGPTEIAGLVLKHRSRLPIEMTIGISEEG